VSTLFKALADAKNLKESFIDYLQEMSKFELVKIYVQHFSLLAELDAYAIDSSHLDQFFTDISVDARIKAMHISVYTAVLR
jgi:hypothetical protein